MALQGSSDVEHEAGGAGHVPQRLLHAGLLRLGVLPQVLALHSCCDRALRRRLLLRLVPALTRALTPTRLNGILDLIAPEF